jgi:hypothetical protein
MRWISAIYWCLPIFSNQLLLYAHLDLMVVQNDTYAGEVQAYALTVEYIQIVQWRRWWWGFSEPSTLVWRQPPCASAAPLRPALKVGCGSIIFFDCFLAIFMHFNYDRIYIS